MHWRTDNLFKTFLTSIACSKAVKIKYGECRPQTCRRPLFLIKSVVDPDNCKCKKQQIIKEERECCKLTNFLHIFILFHYHPIELNVYLCMKLKI